MTKQQKADLESRLQAKVDEFNKTVVELDKLRQTIAGIENDQVLRFGKIQMLRELLGYEDGEPGSQLPSPPINKGDEGDGGGSEPSSNGHGDPAKAHEAAAKVSRKPPTSPRKKRTTAAKKRK